MLPLVVLAVLVAAAVTVGATSLSWLESTREAVARVFPDFSPAARALVLAHAAYESGFGTSTAATRGHNLFNLTAGSSWTGPIVVGGDLEYSSAGVSNITQRFRAYQNADECLRDYWRFLGFSRYANARGYLASADLAGFVETLADGGFFTLPRDRYASGLRATLTKVLA